MTRSEKRKPAPREWRVRLATRATEAELQAAYERGRVAGAEEVQMAVAIALRKASRHVEGVFTGLGKFPPLSHPDPAPEKKP